MSKQIEVMSAVANVIDFTKQQLKINLSEAVSQGKIEITKDQLEKICFYAEASITNSFTRAADQIENSIKK
tara:strand:- start:860 stop:1072 length:213 start_codon:yes stop_codon:yes gene_type:complete